MPSPLLPLHHPGALCSSPPCRHFALRSGVTLPRVINPRSGREALDPEPDDSSAASRQVSKARREMELRRAEERERRQLSFNAYNRDLISRVKATEDWTQLLRLLAPELSTTRYNETTSQRWLNPNKKHTQLTVQSVQVMITHLIKLRGTRRRAMGDDALMAALHSLVVLVETMAPRLHTEAGLWRLLYHPYLYLRRQVELWKEAKEAEQQRQRSEAEQQKDRAAQKGRGVVTDAEMRVKAKAAALRQRAAGRSAGVGDAEEESTGTRRPGIPWDLFMREDPGEEAEAAYEAMSGDERMRVQLSFLLEEEQKEKEQYRRSRKDEEEQEIGAEDRRPPRGRRGEDGPSEEPRSRTKRPVPSFF